MNIIIIMTGDTFRMNNCITEKYAIIYYYNSKYYINYFGIIHTECFVSVDKINKNMFYLVNRWVKVVSGS